MDLESRVRNSIEKKRVIITSAQYNARVNKNFLASLETYAKKNNAEIIILPMAGKSILEDQLSDLLQKYKVISKDLKLNNKIRISNYSIRPQQIDPITGLARFTQSDVSTIFAAPKIRLKVIPNSNNKLPKVLMTTGAITYPNYRGNRIGKIAFKDHTYGAVLVELEGSGKYHFRHLTSLKNGVFYDLGMKYNGNNKPLFVRPEAMVIGDWHTGDTNDIVRSETFRMIKKYNPKNIVLHDIFNGRSINHHDQYNSVNLARNYKDLSLENELRDVANELKAFCNLVSNKSKVYVSKSNHDEWLIQYLQESRFMKDPQNTLIGAELLVKAINDLDPLEEGIRMFYNIPSNLKFLSRNDDLKLRGWQLANHGDKGSNGARGGIRSHEYANGKSITAHSHTPQIFRNVYVVGTSTNLKLEYNEGYSSWMNSHCFLYNNGRPQLVNIMNGKHRK